MERGKGIELPTIRDHAKEPDLNKRDVGGYMRKFGVRRKHLER